MFQTDACKINEYTRGPVISPSLPTYNVSGQYPAVFSRPEPYRRAPELTPSYRNLHYSDLYIPTAYPTPVLAEPYIPKQYPTIVPDQFTPPKFQSIPDPYTSSKTYSNVPYAHKYTNEPYIPKAYSGEQYPISDPYLTSYQTFAYCEPSSYSIYPDYYPNYTEVKGKYPNENKYNRYFERGYTQFNHYPEYETLLNMERDKVFREVHLSTSQISVLERERRGVLERIQAYHEQLMDVERKCRMERINMEKNKVRLNRVSEQFFKGEREGDKYRTRRRSRR